MLTPASVSQLKGGWGKPSGPITALVWGLNELVFVKGRSGSF